MFKQIVKRKYKKKIIVRAPKCKAVFDFIKELRKRRYFYKVVYEEYKDGVTISVVVYKRKETTEITIVDRPVKPEEITLEKLRAWFWSSYKKIRREYSYYGWPGDYP